MNYSIPRITRDFIIFAPFYAFVILSVELAQKGGIMGNLRRFLGLKDIEYVALYAVFPGSPAVLVSPVSLEARWPLVVEGPEHHINFLFPFLKRSPAASDGGEWMGIEQESATRINLSYVYDDAASPTLVGVSKKNSMRIELIQITFRQDAAKYANLRFAEISVIEVVWEDRVAMHDRVDLPRGFKNGEITLPSIWLQ